MSHLIWLTFQARPYVLTRMNLTFASPPLPVYHISLCPFSVLRLQEHWECALPSSAANTAKSFILTQKKSKSHFWTILLRSKWWDLTDEKSIYIKGRSQFIEYLNKWQPGIWNWRVEHKLYEEILWFLSNFMKISSWFTKTASTSAFYSTRQTSGGHQGRGHGVIQSS